MGAKLAVTPLKLAHAGCYDLRIAKNGRLLGCASPIGLFPGQPKYGCSGPFSTAGPCDAAAYPVKNTQYVWAVHAGCQTAEGRGTYGYAYDDGIGLKQCPPITRYEWVLCPDGTETSIKWNATKGLGHSMRRFRVVNKCKEAIWVEQAGAKGALLPLEAKIRRFEPQGSYTYSIPNRGLPSTRFLPKTGCNLYGNNCDLQSMPPCPLQGCDLPVDTKFEASWGCLYATGNEAVDHTRCALTGQGHPSTYQDWWDGSAVDGWTLPFTVLVEDNGRGLTPNAVSSSDQCGNVVCAMLDAEKLCPTDEFLTPVI